MTSLRQSYSAHETPRSAGLNPPQALQRPAIRKIHGDEFTDPYEWMRDKDSAETKAYIEAQNAYCQQRLEPLNQLKFRLFDEFKSRIQESDMSVPTRMHGYWYFTRTREGSQYAMQCRMPVTDPNDWNPPEIDRTSAPGSMPGEEVFFDNNREAEGHDFFRLGGLDVSSDGRWMLYCVDTNGDERYDIRLRDLATGEDTPDRIDQVSSGPVLTPDAQWVFYAKVNQAWRPYSVWRHKVGTPTSSDVCVFTEKDERYWVGVGLSFDERSVVIGSSSKTTSEVLLLSVDEPEGTFKPFIKRQDGVEYDVSFASLPAPEGGDGLPLPVAVVYQNLDNPNFSVRLIDMRSHQPPFSFDEGVVIAQGSPYGCEDAGSDQSISLNEPYYREGNPQILQGARGLSIEGMGIYQHFALLSYRANSLMHLAVIPTAQAAQDLQAGRPWSFREVEPAGGDISRIYAIASGDNASYEAPTMRYSFASYTAPAELHELNVTTGEDRLLKRAQVLGDFDQANYAERRLWVKVRDGAEVPVSLVWRRGLVPALEGADEGLSNQRLEAPSDIAALTWPEAAGREAPASSSGSPCFITGYGSYEIASDPGFSVGRLSMLDRGVVYACIHTRGGGEMGRAWYEQGRRLKKLHTFEDFIDCTAALQEAGWIDPTRTVANGGSAGGLLMGAIANMAPQLYAGIEADVPFVDALNSILDPSLPLTVTEWDEWGDPLHNLDVYRYMKAYTPYENVPEAEERQARFGSEHFPKIFATTSLNDTRVLYVEPLKWVARLQESAVAADAIVKIEVEAGHGGTTGRYRQWEELALENAVCLSILKPDDPDLLKG
ncbi:peptidase S9 [Bombiscardovia apis]|uniref:Peptidase S9 n=1 Tax=Bombiscardovia apis TaxID=2932182 RepID=A0ABM8BBE5_9BIFI|nr:S9 family peptidase [Bombiscardovia apis]BDR54255.1 peptidase S9 [Bombiscardovia apis]